MTSPLSPDWTATLPDYQVESLSRPPQVFPAAPRVVYRVPRDVLSHEGRIRRIDRVDTLGAFRDFSEAFHARDPGLPTTLRAYLHNHGFLPDKAALYALPNESLDDYLSDFMVTLLPMANGLCAVALRDRRLFWQLYRGLLPLAPVAGLVLGGALVGKNPVPPSARLLARPLMAGGGEASETSFYPSLDDVPRDRGDLVVLAWPESAAESNGLLRLVFVHDHRTDSPVVLGAALLHGDPTALDQPGACVLTSQVDVVTGIVGPARVFGRDGAAPPVTNVPGALARHRALAVWPGLVTTLVTGLLRLPIGVVGQLDIVLTAQGPVVVDATDRLDAAVFQVHRPLLASPMAKAFVREFGL